MEGASSNMAPPGAYESHEAREAQPTSTAATVLTTSGDGTASVVSTRSDDVEMHAVESLDVPQQPASAGASMDQEEKREDNEENISGGDSTVVMNLKFLHRDRVTLQCASSILIADLKQLVRNAYIQAVEQDGANSQVNEQQETHPATQPLRLIYKGKVLKDDQSLASYNFLSDDTVHAIFSRPSAAPTINASSGGASNSTDHDGLDRSSGTSTEPGPGGNGGMFMFETENTRDHLPVFSRIINSMVNSAMNGADDAETTATIRVYPVTTTGASSVQNTATPSPHSGPHSAATQTQRGASVVPASASGPAIHSVAPIPTPLAPSAPPPTDRPGSAMLLNQAAAMRRSIPALELAPLSRHPDLSEEMYTLGNAMRESADTYLAIHRQLQFIATRFLQDSHLSDNERARLRSRVLQLIPVMENVGHLSNAVMQQLADSPYGQRSATGFPTSQVTATPVPQASGGSTPQTPSQPNTTPTVQPPLAQAVQTILTELLGAAGVNQASPHATAGNQALNGLPSFLSGLVAMATTPQTNSSPPHNEAQPSTSSGPSSEPPATTDDEPSRRQHD